MHICLYIKHSSRLNGDSAVWNNVLAPSGFLRVAVGGCGMLLVPFWTTLGSAWFLGDVLSQKVVHCRVNGLLTDMAIANH